MAKRAKDTTPGWEQAAKDADLTLWLSDSVPVYFRKIVCPPEGFWMGSRGFSPNEEPMHRVRLKPFYMATFPVTQEQWRAVVKGLKLRELDSDPSKFKDSLRPVEWVSWTDVQRWCVGLNQRWRQLAPTRNATLNVDDIRLPCEAEWEFACKGDAWHTEYANGDGESRAREVGWFDDNSSEELKPVGLLKPNAAGLCDMHGNVEEWCADFFDADAYRKRPDGWVGRAWSRGLAGGSRDDDRRVVRGGSWDFSAGWLRSASRLAYAPGDRSGFLGFRFCLRFREPSGRSPIQCGAQADSAATGAAADAARPIAEESAEAVGRKGGRSGAAPAPKERG